MLRVYGPATASTLAERTDQAVANVSHHLRVLGASNFIEEAPELAKDKRERWWRLVSSSLRWSSSDFADDPAGAVISETVQSLGFEQHIGVARAWFAADKAEWEGWSDGAFSADKWLQMTPQELRQLSDEIGELFRKWGNREVPDDGQQRESVMVFAYGMPAKP